MRLDPTTIERGWRARDDLGDLNALCASIADRGQVQPIAVRKVNGHYEVVAGVRRMTACERLERPVLAVVVEAATELDALSAQIAENVARKDFDELELGRGLKRQKELHEEIYPSTRVGATGRKGAGVRSKADFAESAKSGVPERATRALSREIGISERRAQELIELASLPKRALAAISGAKTTRARNKAAKDALRAGRVERKRAKLVKRAQEAAPRPVDTGPRVVLHLRDNREFFATTPPESWALILTDPPYGQRQSVIQHVTRKDISSKFGGWDKLDVGWVVKAAPALAESGQMLIFCPLEAIGDYKLVCEAVELTYRGAILWHKTNPGTVHRSTYLSSVEAVVWVTKGNRYHFEPWENAGAPEVHNLIEGPVCGGNERLDHPTQKPEWLLERLLRRHAAPGAQVLDPFAGVGSTLAACKRLGIDATGVELDPGYVHQARLRLQAQ